MTNTQGKPSGTAHFMATWSDSKAVMDYQNFLSSGKQEIELASDCASIIVRSPSSTDGDEYSQIAQILYDMGNGDDCSTLSNSRACLPTIRR